MARQRRGGYNPLPSVLLALKLEGLYGKAGSSFGFRNASLTKRITYLAPAVTPPSKPRCA
ncbi:MAG: hypothetical protein VYD18_13765 [Candidatus Latescibacterota bacterium]|nr:hypothetical protein [Candidatus Latescibacterota bacterium]